MALIAMRTVIDISIDALMIAVGLSFVGVFMATQAREDQIVRGIRVASIAATGPTVRLREVRVVEHCSQPVRRAMAGLAGRREARRSVIRIGRGVVIRLVAAYASRVGDAVVAIDVALGAGDGCRVKARQRPPRGRVIELAVRP